MAAEGYADTSVERAKGHVGPYLIPLRILQSRDIDNLGMAGRCVSSSKAALGTLRVMQTCAVMGEAIGTAAAVAVKLRHIPSIWHYDVASGTVLAETVLAARPGVARWIDWPLDLALPEALHHGGYLRLELEINKPGQLLWETAAAPLPGCPACFLMPSATPGSRGERYRRHSETPGSTFAFRLGNAQPVYRPANAANSYGRPYKTTGHWRSDPAQPLPQSLTCEWDTPQNIGQIDLHFGVDLLTELSTRPALSTDADIARDYALEAHTGDGWQTVVEVSGNYQCHRFHTFQDALAADALRLTIHASSGSPSATLAALRAYETPNAYPDPWTTP